MMTSGLLLPAGHEKPVGDARTAAYPGQTLPAVIQEWAARTPTAPALLDVDGAVLDYAGLWAHIVATRQGLHARGIGRGDRVVIALPDGPLAAAAFLAVAATATAVPLHPALEDEERRARLRRLRPRAVLIDEDADPGAWTTAESPTVLGVRAVPGAAPGIFTLTGEAANGAADTTAVGPDDNVLIMHTSSTTGVAKRVPRTHAKNRVASGRVVENYTLRPEDRCLNIVSLTHTQGMSALLAALESGGSIICTAGYDPVAFPRWLEQGKPSWTSTSPTVLRSIMEHWPAAGDPARRSSLQFLRSTASALDPGLLARVEQVLGAPVIESYGMSEALQLATQRRPPHPRRTGSVGQATPGWLVIRDPDSGAPLPPGVTGEIVVAGPTVFAGYLDDPDLNQRSFTPDGWFRTGDLGYLDAEGWLFLTGRLQELINRGGEKIAPVEVERVLLAHPDVVEAAVFAIPDDRLGEEIAAAVVAKPGASITEAAVRAFAAARLPYARTPRRVAIAPELPRGPTGKPLRLGLARALGLDSPRPPVAPAPVAEEDTPATPVEAALTGIWQRLLGVGALGRNDDVFTLGGHSLLVARVIADIETVFGQTLHPRDIFEAPTIAALATRLESGRAARPVSLEGSRSGPALVTLQSRGDGTPVFFVPGGRGGEANIFRAARLARALDPVRPFYAFLAGPVNPRQDAGQWLAATVTAYIQESRDRQPAGPYDLVGSCAGGLLALAMAHRLLEMGEAAPRLVLIDTRVPVAFRAAEPGANATGDSGQPGSRPARSRSPRVRLLTAVPPRYWPGSLTLLVNEDWARSDPDPTLGWRPLVGGDLTVHEIPGDHGAFLRDQPEALAQLLGVLLSPRG